MNVKMYEIVRKTAIFITVIFLLSVEQIACRKNRYEIYGKHPINVLQLYSPRADSRKSAHHIYTPQNGTQNNQVFGMYNDEVVDLSPKEVEAYDEKGISRKNRPCIKCPREITAYADEGLDGVLVEPPAPISCITNLPFAPNLYRTETLFGPDFQFVLPQGRHSLIAKIRDIETGIIVGSCHLKYNVIVRRCEFPRLKSRRVKMFCTAESVWGSKCAFECKRDYEFLTHHDSITCNNDLEWIGHEPECGRHHDNAIPEINQPEMNMENEIPCTPPHSFRNGQFKCDGGEQTTVDDSYQPGSICRAECNENHSIPIHLQPMSVIGCSGGTWNSTNDLELCYIKNPLRRHLSRRSRTRNQH